MAKYAGRIAVLGGGLQGCLVALALAERGARVTLFERAPALLSRTILASEGKIHLGYVYAGDRSLATARTMMRGALSFAPIVRRFLGSAHSYFNTSTPFAYAVHRGSLLTAAEVGRYLQAVHVEIMQIGHGREDSYFGIDLAETPRIRHAADRAHEFDPRSVIAVFDTPEIAIHPSLLAMALRERVVADPSIEVRTHFTVDAIADNDNGFSVVGANAEGNAGGRYDHVVNALWDGRLAVDVKRGLIPNRPWLHRFKYGIHFVPAKRRVSLPSVTVVLGPFGDIVSYADGSIYLSWYPVCMTGLSIDATPPAWPKNPAEPLRARLVRKSLEAMTAIVPALGDLDSADVRQAEAKGGVIIAWGKTDIDDPGSELHRRYEIGVHSHGHYHSIDPGKLTMAPYFAVLCAERIAGSETI